VDSAIDTVPPSTTTGTPMEIATTRANPAPLEVQVNVSGAKPSGTSGAKDLFSEDTTTLLVFRDGAVVQLASPISVGQLLFLTHKSSKREVICQVIRKKHHTTKDCYVEIEFTEAQDDFWGISFGEITASEANLPQEGGAAQEIAPSGQGEQIGMPGGNAAQGLELAGENTVGMPGKDSALAESGRGGIQLRETKKNLFPSEKTARSAVVGTSEKFGGADSGAATDVIGQSPDSVSKLGCTPEKDVPAEKNAKVTGRKTSSPTRAMVGMVLPTQAVAERKAPEVIPDGDEDLLPKPELDFSKIPSTPASLADDHRHSIRNRTGKGIQNTRVRVLGGLLVVVLTGSAWYGGWWKILPIRKKDRGPATGAPAAKTVPRGSERTAVPPPAPQVGGGEVKAALPKSGDVLTAPATPEVSGTAEPVSASMTAVRLKKEKSALEPRTVAAAPEIQAETAPAPLESDAPVEPARLLRSVAPVYPPEAMLNYITGDVKAEVVVEKSGHIGEVRLISGPSALRAAAVEALKQYEYAPATQGGKPVASKTVVVIKFWFTP